MSKIEGIYFVKGRQLFTETGQRYLIGERQNVTPKKPKYFLIDKSTPAGSYISSLYPVSTATYEGYTFDYSGVKYELKIEGLQATILTV